MINSTKHNVLIQTAPGGTGAGVLITGKGEDWLVCILKLRSKMCRVLLENWEKTRINRKTIQAHHNIIKSNNEEEIKQSFLKALMKTYSGWNMLAFLKI